MSDDNGNDETSAVAPKLTIGQRLLTSLPDLQRKPKAATAPDTSDDSAEDASPSDNGNGSGAGSATPASATKAPPRNSSGLTKEELTHAIKRIDDRERLLAILSAPIGVVVGALLTVLAVHFNPPVHHKDHLTFVTIVVFEGGARVLLSAVVLVAAYTRRRSFVGFALLFLGTSLGLPFALPFWALGAWLIWRVFKYQRELTALGGTAARQRKPAAGRDNARSGARTSRPSTLAEARAQGAARSRRKKELPTTGPPPSKRYTPPKPVRPKPPAPS